MKSSLRLRYANEATLNHRRAKLARTSALRFRSVKTIFANR